MPRPLRVYSHHRFATMDDFLFPASALKSNLVPAIAALPGGGFVAVWTNVISGTNSAVAQFHDRSGLAVGSEFVVGPGHGPTSAASLAAGGFVVNWTADGVVRARIYDAAGNPAGAHFTANTTSNGVQTTSQVTELAGGGFVITWRDPHATGFNNIRGQVFAADGTRVGGEFIGGDAVPGTEYGPEITALSGGGFVVAWSQTGGDSSFGTGSRAQVFDATGNKLGAAFTVNTITVGGQSGVKVAAMPSGGFMVFWYDDGNTTSGNPNNGNAGTWAQLFDAGGNKVGDDVHLYAGNYVADVEMIPGIGFAVVWKDASDPAAPGSARLRLQIFDFDLNRVGDEFVAAPHLQSISNLPEMTALADGSLVVAWQNWIPQSNVENPQATIFFATTRGTADADVMSGTAGRDFLAGLEGPDLLTGGGGNDGLDGSEGNDVLHGEAGNDALAGDLGDDRLFGGEGDDMLVGGRDRDHLHAGNGFDVIRFETAGESRGYVLRSDGKQLKPDVIVDFIKMVDKIDLSAIDAKTGTAVNDAFTFIGIAAFTNEAGQLRAVTNGGVTSVFGDIDGNGIADLHIVLPGSEPLGAADFIL